MRAKERELLRYLKKHCLGQQNALGGEKLMKVFRISGTELRKLIHDLRVDGAPICSDRTGYFYPSNSGEVYAAFLQLQRKERGLRMASSGMIRAMGDFRLPGGGEADR